MVDALIRAFAILGFIVVYHNGPRFLVPKFRPFTCPLCLSWWASLALAAYSGCEASYCWGIGLATVVAALGSYFAPEVFYAED